MLVDTLESVLERQTKRWHEFSSERKEDEAFYWWEKYPQECETLAHNGEKDMILRLTLDRTRQRFAASDELETIDRQCRLVMMAAESSDEDCDVAEARRDVATAAWHAKYDRLWPAEEMEAARQKLDAEKEIWNAWLKEATMTPVLPSGTPPMPANHRATPPNGMTPMIGPGARPPQIVAPEYSEIEVADRFADNYATHLRFIKARGAWLHWDGRRWRNDETDHVANMARLHCKAEAALCASTPGNTNAQARALCSDKTVRAILRLAAIDPRIASMASAWDQDEWLLGTPDSVVDLRDGTVRAARPEDHVTKSTAVSPGDECPQWLAFLNRATDGDVEMQKYLQRLGGYALTGSTREHSLHFAFGPGGSGKGTFMHAVSSILRDYHVVTAIETLTDTKFDRHPAEVAALQGARLVTCSETERGRQWAESRIKQWTGGDQISARFMNQNFFTFIPTFKLLISGNYKPHMRPDTAMRRRFQLIPFKTAIPKVEQDPTLGAKLEKEWPGILGWMIAGAVEWQRIGLCPPAAVLDATSEYMNDEAEDVISAWLHDCCEPQAGAETKSGELYRSYKFYAEQAGEKVTTSNLLSKELKQLGFDLVRNSRGRFVVGLRLKSPVQPQYPLPPMPPCPV